jgi:hypothetical protein
MGGSLNFCLTRTSLFKFIADRIIAILSGWTLHAKILQRSDLKGDDSSGKAKDVEECVFPQDEQQLQQSRPSLQLPHKN